MSLDQASLLWVGVVVVAHVGLLVVILWDARGQEKYFVGRYRELVERRERFEERKARRSKVL
jgi:hypothetical protein